MHNSLAGCKVRTLDDALRVFQDHDLTSPVIGQLPKDVEIQLGGVLEIEGREWVEATLSDGTTGYLVSASARSHTEIGDGPLDFDSKPVDASPGFRVEVSQNLVVPRAVAEHTTVSFSSSTGEAASAILAAFGWAILIVTTAWGYARLYSWQCQSLRFSDGTTARFTGNPKTIWFSAMLIALMPQADTWVTRIIVKQTDDGAARTALIWVFLLCLWFAWAVIWLKVSRWFVGGISLSSGTGLSFDGGIGACFGISCGSYLFGALILPTYGLILLAFPLLTHWSIHWWIGHVHSEQKRLRFVGSLAQTWWRILTAMMFSILIVTIPSAMVWLCNWGTANIRIESEAQ
jgi:hypothetical protein